MNFAGNFLADLDAYYSIQNITNVKKKNTFLSKSLNLDALKTQLHLGPASEKKQWERIYARLSLGELLGLKLPQDLKLLSFDCNFSLPLMTNCHTSLSHTQQHVACIYTKNSDIFLGIDIEPHSRKINLDAKRLFAHAKDTLHQNILDLWVKKEAAFKAIFHWQTAQNLEQTSKIRGLHQIIIKNNLFYLDENHPLGELLSITHPELLCSVAKINRLKMLA